MSQGATRTRTQSQKPDQGFLEELQKGTLETLLGMAEPVADLTLDRQLDEMEKTIAGAMEEKDQRLKKARMQIVEGNTTTLRQSADKQQTDLAEVMVGLKELMAEIGLEYEDLTKPTGDEQSILTAAEARVKQAEEVLLQAGTALFFRSRKIKNAETELQNAKAAIPVVKAQVDQLARKRLMEATLDKSLQHFQVQVGRVVDIMTRRQQAIELQLRKVGERRKEALAMKAQAAEKLEALDRILTDLEGKLPNMEAELNALVNGSPEYVAKEGEVGTLRNQVEEARGNRNAALAVYNSKERFAQELQIHETTQRKLRDNQRIWIAVLKSDTQERLVTFASRLEGMKGMADQQVAHGMDQIGTEIDGRNAEMMALIGSTSDKVRMGMFEAHPDRIRRLVEATGAQAEAIAEMRKREAAAVQRFHERYGINPRAESFFSYGGEGAGTGS